MLVYAYSKLLRRRIANQGCIDFNFILIGQALSAPDFNEHLGRFVGWFDTVEGEPVVMLLGRKVANADISHVFVVRLNPEDQDFPIEQRALLSSKLRGSPEFIAVNWRVNVAGFCTYAVLLEAIYFLMARDVFAERSPISVKMVGLGTPSPLTTDDYDRSPPCRHVMPSDSRDLIDLMRANNLYLGDLDQPELSSFFNILRIPVDGHYVYGISYRQEEALLLLVPTIRQAPPQLRIGMIQHEVNQRFPGLFKVFYTVRARVAGDCNSSTILMACILLTRIPLFYVDPEDIDFALEDLDILSIGSSQRLPSQSTPGPSQRREIANQGANIDPRGTVVAEASHTSRNPRVLSTNNQAASPEVTIRTQQQVRREVGEYRAWMAAADDLTSTYPSSIRVKPCQMAIGSVLKDLEWMLRQIAVVTLAWERHATVKVLECCVLDELGRHHIDDKSERFIILPVRRDNTDDQIGLMMFDKGRSEWGWMHPENTAAKSSDLLAEVKEQLAISGPRYLGWSGQIIIISSSYHKDFAYVHLVMALYYVGRLFAYAVRLPAKVVYGELSFRRYAYHHCLAVQVANQEFNLQNDLITADGELKEGARVSLPSPVQFERAVVPSDLCGFCKKRGFKNLGRHMSMAHGGQALMANQLRQIQYGYTSND